MRDYSHGDVGQILSFRCEVCNRANVHRTSHGKTTRLPYVFLITVGAGKLVNTRIFEVVIFFRIMSVTEKLSYSFSCFVSNAEVCKSEQFSDKPGFLTNVCKGGEFLGSYSVFCSLGGILLRVMGRWLLACRI